MTIKELFEKSMKKDCQDLQALIMFLVFEKETLSMDDPQTALNLYFMDKHRKRMNQELQDYKKEMNMSYGAQVYEIKTSSETLYVLAYTEKQARFIAGSNLINIEKIKCCHLDMLMSINGVDRKLKNIIKDKKVGILGGF